MTRRFGIRLSVWTVGRHLKRWGFTPQKPARRAWEQNPEQVPQWLEKEYPRIHRPAQKEKARIYWGDEMGLRSIDAVGRSYVLRCAPDDKMAFSEVSCRHQTVAQASRLCRAAEACGYPK